MASSIKNVMLLDSGAFDCGVCQCPLKPPIFQCEVGHMVCSECSEKMAAAETCHVCRRTLAGGYKRCYGAEHIVESLRVPCPNKAYGCSFMLARYDESVHLQVCQYPPFHCPAEDCVFITGNQTALLEHFQNTHKWPSTTVHCSVPNSATRPKPTGTNLALVDGFNVLNIIPSGLVILKVTRESCGRVITLIKVRRAGRRAKRCRFMLVYETPCGTHRLEYAFNNMASTNPSLTGGGLSTTDDHFNFVVPNSVEPLNLIFSPPHSHSCWHFNDLDAEAGAVLPFQKQLWQSRV